MTQASCRSGLFAAAIVLAGLAAGAEEAAIARTDAIGSRADWSPVVDYQCLQLTVTGPGVTYQKRYSAGDHPSFSLPTNAADGTYRWELSRSTKACQAAAASPRDAEGGAQALVAPQNAGPEDENGRTKAQRAVAPVSGPTVQSGSFNVQNGSIAAPSSAPERGAK